MLVFLKLGGSLITNKRQAETPRLDVIDRLAQEIAAARRANPAMKLLIGNGAGSFGHVPARKYHTRDGVETAEEWFGYAETADAAARLNRLIVAALLKAGVPAWTLQPSAMLSCTDGKITAGSVDVVGQALLNGLVPVVHGDVALDSVRGGTIVSTEEVFEWLAVRLPSSVASILSTTISTTISSSLSSTLAANRKDDEGTGNENSEGVAARIWRLQKLVLAGEVEGIYTADPLIDPTAELIPSITPKTLAAVAGGLGSSHGVDVTGGMSAKVQQAFEMIEQSPGLEVTICSGLIEQTLFHVLNADNLADTTLSDGALSHGARHVGTLITGLTARMYN